MKSLKKLLTFQGKILTDAILWNVFNGSYILFCVSILITYLSSLSRAALPHGLVLFGIIAVEIGFGFVLWKRYYKRMAPLYVNRSWPEKFAVVMLSAISFYVPFIMLSIQSRSPAYSTNPLIIVLMMFFSLLNLIFIVTGLYYVKAFRFKSK